MEGEGQHGDDGDDVQHGLFDTNLRLDEIEQSILDLAESVRLLRDEVADLLKFVGVAVGGLVLVAAYLIWRFW